MEDDKKYFYLFRHGRTYLNAQRKLQGKDETLEGARLNEEGRAQAESIIPILSNKGIQVIYSSPLRRAMETAEIVSKGLNVNIIPYSNLHEIDVGDAAGKGAEELEPKYGTGIVTHWDCIDPQYDNFSFLTGETKIQGRKRVIQAIQDIASNSKEHTIGIAAHGFILRQLLIAIGNEQPEKIKNCEVIHLLYDKPTAKLSFVERF